MGVNVICCTLRFIQQLTIPSTSVSQNPYADCTRPPLSLFTTLLQTQTPIWFSATSFKPHLVYSVFISPLFPAAVDPPLSPRPLHSWTNDSHRRARRSFTLLYRTAQPSFTRLSADSSFCRHRSSLVLLCPSVSLSTACTLAAAPVLFRLVFSFLYWKYNWVNVSFLGLIRNVITGWNTFACAGQSSYGALLCHANARILFQCMIRKLESSLKRYIAALGKNAGMITTLIVSSAPRKLAMEVYWMR